MSKKAIMINIDDVLHSQFKAAVSAEGKTMTEVIETMILSYLDNIQQKNRDPRLKESPRSRG